MDTDNLFAQAKLAVQQGQRDEGRRLLSSVLRERPDFAPAWLWMSGVLDDLQQRRECLERVLALEPDNPAARQGLALLDIQSLASTVEFAAPEATPKSSAASAKRLGDYLVSQRFISQAQLDAALEEQQRESRFGRVVPIGDILIRRRWLTMQALSRTLAMQKEERQRNNQNPASSRLGDFLVQQKLISSQQLEQVIARQAALKQQGNNLQLGELLVRSGALSRKQLEEAVEIQKQEFFNQFSR